MSRAKDIKKRDLSRIKRKKRIRSKISGTSQCPRLSIYKSNSVLYVQAIDDVASTTLLSFDSRSSKSGVNKESAKKLAVEVSTKLKEANVEEVVFDRNGYLYHGVIAQFCETLKENKIKV